MVKAGYKYSISIHPPREGWDAALIFAACAVNRISIHPPREGWDF